MYSKVQVLSLMFQGVDLENINRERMSVHITLKIVVVLIYFLLIKLRLFIGSYSWSTVGKFSVSVNEQR